ncbi:hypothetical protein FD755_018974 [Muntiacus reevesi]|uniref:Interferon alpha-inducible protein 27-like protein 2 n=1 Tax=Muntiacus reevesi TaxID=9886 RepID=A0A5N3X705_MUNRE|nr:hypothetical protein FD755_018974 [Muntiacus reevesi]
MSAKAIESWEGGALDALLPELLSEEEEEPSQSSNQASDGSSPGKTPQGPHQGPDGSGSDPRDPPQSEDSNFYHYAGKTATALVFGALAVGSVPVVLGAMGFTGAGIAASSIAAKMMSAAAVTSGGGVAAGSLVATLQSVGAAGLSTSSNILLGSAGSVCGAKLWDLIKKSGSHAGDDSPGPQDVSPPNDKPSSSQNSSKNHKK